MYKLDLSSCLACFNLVFNILSVLLYFLINSYIFFSQVKDLEEFTTCTDYEALKSWRAISMAGSVISPSPSEDLSLLEEIEREPRMRFALTGDSPLIMSPCLPPPTRDKVATWLRSQKTYRKMATVQSDIHDVNRDDVARKKDILRESIEDNSDLSGSDEDERAIFSLSSLSDSDQNEEQDTSAVKITVDHDVTTYKNHYNDTRTRLHSTPLLRKSSTDLKNPTLTPICREAKMKSSDSACFTTPQHIKPVALTSTGKGRLRQSLFQKQLQVSYSSHHFYLEKHFNHFT